MTGREDRRNFLKTSSLAAAGLSGGILSDRTLGQQPAPAKDTNVPPPVGNSVASPSVPAGSEVAAEIDGFSRFKPSRGNDPDSDYYLGKMMPGFRSAS